MDLDSELVGSKRQKRTEQDKNFISGERPVSQQKTQDSEMWQEHERAYLEDATLNVIDDEEVG